MMPDTHNDEDNAHSVTVIGLGPMGQSMTRAFLQAGYAVTVWNRTASKAEAMAEHGAMIASSVAEALNANEIVVLSLTHYEAMYRTLENDTEALQGKVIVNLSSDSPANARSGAEWILSHGAQYLTGGFMSQGDDIEHPLSYIFFSGPRDLFDRHKDLLGPLSAQEYLGEDYGLSQLFYQGLLGLFHPLLLAAEQSFAMIANSGHNPDDFLPYAQRFMDSMKDFLAYTNETSKQGGWGTLASLRMMEAGAQHVIDALHEAGVDASVTEAVRRIYTRAIVASDEAGEAVPTYRLIADVGQ